jgi:signal transduction histidine kinase
MACCLIVLPLQNLNDAIGNPRTRNGMLDILIGGDANQIPRVTTWLATWGLRARQLRADQHPAQVAADRASAVIFASGQQAAILPARVPATAAMAPLLLIGPTASPELREAAWIRIADPGPEGTALAAALRPLLESVLIRSADGTAFSDLVNHELRTPLTAAGTALQTLARQLERAGGPPLEMVDIALRNLRRLERTVDWACDYLTDGPLETLAWAPSEVPLVDLLEDLDALEVPLPLTWASGMGDWDLSARIDRESWRRLLRQVLRAIALLAPGQAVHLDLAQLPDQADTEVAGGLLLVFRLPQLDGGCREGRSALEDPSEQLRRLLTFTVNPTLAHRLELRLDVMRLSDHLRLRLMLPLAGVDASCLAV